jgi:hypothetical protein
VLYRIQAKYADSNGGSFCLAVASLARTGFEAPKKGSEIVKELEKKHYVTP